MKADLREELNRPVRIREGGREIEVTKQQAIMKALLARAMEGDARAATLIFAECARAFGDEAEDQASKPPSDDEFELLKAFVEREQKRRTTAARETDTAPSNNPTKGASQNET